MRSRRRLISQRRVGIRKFVRRPKGAQLRLYGRTLQRERLRREGERGRDGEREQLTWAPVHAQLTQLIKRQGLWHDAGNHREQQEVREED